MGIAELYLSRSSLLFGGVEVPLERAEAVIVGVPFDYTSSYRPGSRFAPRAIREAAANIEFYSLRANLDVENIGISDLGDIAVSSQPLETLQRIEQVTRELLENMQDKLLIVLGGEHTITLGVAKALAATREQPLCLIVFDAHLDLRQEYMGEKYSHASVMRRVVEQVTSNIFYIGARAFTSEEFSYMRSHGLQMVTPQQARLLGLAEIVRRIRNWAKSSECKTLYISFDIDAYDPAYAPGAANPEPDGLETWLALELLHRIIIEVPATIAVFDLVEVSPPYDCSWITSILAAKTVVEAIAANHVARRAARQP
ncbi:agmatinase [Hyperthermus butylicus]|uniref:Agmatinase (Agmatine ureohydrolase) n=1 Tax=Hyperthermus butylicus (strain DSM 5456 / JCM 9403 / PLM1-5) TaxID=415426 RepID=A2BIW8_HYPBU|nr:agmatinase [Hyperthermus butylicus]ABM79929.1 Agmatinase (agmatine ureohydrolase) [Hyperthermus butylicus DSM 5456]